MNIFVILIFILSAGTTWAGELITSPEKIVSAAEGGVPQAPRISPNGKSLVYEMYRKEKTTIWLIDLTKRNGSCLTCSLDGSVENPYWHPSGNFLVFNEVPKGNQKYEPIYTVSLAKGSITAFKEVARGARPQFSSPNGSVIFFETAQGDNNILAYQILGNNPLSPSETIRIQLRGPIQRVNDNAEVSHPSLAPDGTTIVFAARASTIKGADAVVLNDTDRQKIYRLRKELRSVSSEKIAAELGRMSKHFEVQDRYRGEILDFSKVRGSDYDSTIINRSEFQRIMQDNAYLSSPTIVPGYTKRHMFFAWYLNILDRLDSSDDQEVGEMLLPRLWTTDVFGAAVKPLVKDLKSAPLPQKWPTVARDGRSVVFEAGDYSDRHIYMVVRKDDGWSDAVKLTEAGSYNSSPELDPSGQWLYFESNRDGKKGIWRAKLNWQQINQQLGL